MIRKFLSKIKRVLLNLKVINLKFYKLKRTESKEKNINSFCLFDTAEGSSNLGDYVISFFGKKILDELGVNILISISTHKKNKKEVLNKIPLDSKKLLLGTNILSKELNIERVWKIPGYKYLNDICLIGVGVTEYKKNINLFTKIFYQKFLDKSFLHSVRDSYTEKFLKNIGIRNVINTSCPTMWNLTPEFCKNIPEAKSKNVITTVTDYDRDEELDFFMLDVLLECYENVRVWIQGSKDLQYLEKYPNFKKLNLINNTLNDYEEALKSETDYVGTRLHGGIKALNEKKRTLIIAVDDRAIAISNDTNLPVIRRDEVKLKLKPIINSKYKTDIHIPIGNINIWKAQFGGN